jgi:hypothetical protein
LTCSELSLEETLLGLVFFCYDFVLDFFDGSFMGALFFDLR